MTIKVGGGGSPFPFPTLPAALNDGRIFAAGNVIPHNGTLVDNIVLPTTFGTAATGDMSGRLDTTPVWTVNATDINAACDGFLCANSAWYDNINDRLYVFGVDSGTTPDTIYTAYITLETGAVTNIGSATLSTDPATRTNSLGCAVGRAAVASGDFTLYFADRTIVIDESTGAEVSNVASANTSDGKPVGHYATADGAVLFAAFYELSGEVVLSAAGNSAALPAPSPYVASSTAYPIPWGDKVKLFLHNTASFAMLKTFDRTEFDALLVEIAEFGGLI